MPALSLHRPSLRRLESWAQSWAHVGGLAAIAWLVLPRGGPDLFQRMLQGWLVASLALGWAVAVVMMLRLVVRHLSRVDVAAVNFRAAAGIWYAPAILMALSPAGVTAAVVLVICATRLLCAPSPGADWAALSSPSILGAGELSFEFVPRHLAPAMAASAGLQGAVVLLLLDHPVTGFALLSLSVAIFTATAIALGAWAESRPPNLPRSILGLCLTFLLAMMAGQFMGGGRGWGFAAGSGTAALFGHKPAAPPGRPPDQPDSAGRKAPTPPPGATGEVSPDPRLADINVPGSFPGVILWPEVQPEVTLIAPYPATRAPGAPALARPFVIPFGGEYWMFRWPFARPPRSSYFRRGSPAHLAFSTTDRTELEMEALQKLDRSIRLACCAKIQLTVENADRSSAGIALELILIDNDPPYEVLSLGVSPLHSAPRTDAGALVPVSETVDFAVPAAPALAKFDELKVLFHRDLKHQDHSSRVAIDRFVLVP